MTGACLKVQRDGKWLNIEVEHLTDEERSEALDEECLMDWLNLVCNKLSEVQNTYFEEIE